MFLALPPDCTEPATVFAEICAPFPLASFMLPLAKSLLVNEPSRPIQHQLWQLKNKHILLKTMYRGWMCSSVHASGWHSLIDTHQPLACRRSWESGHKHRADVPQCKGWVWPSGLIVSALHLILGSPSPFSSCFELESRLQISFTLTYQWSRFLQSEVWLSYPILNVQTRSLLQNIFFPSPQNFLIYSSKNEQESQTN